MKLWMSSWCQPSVVRDSTRALVVRSARTMKRVRESQRRREGKVITIPANKNSSRRNDLAQMGRNLLRPYREGWLCRSCGGSVCRFDFGEGGRAALADGGVTGVFADMG